MDFWGNAIFSVTPTILFGLLFWFVFRTILRADRSERTFAARIEAEERARFDAERGAAAPAEVSREA